MTLILLCLAAGFVTLAGLGLWFMIQADRQRRRHHTRLQRARRMRAQPAAAPQAKRTAKQERHGTFGRIEAHLAQTSLRVSIEELLVQVSLAVLGLYALAVLFLGMHPVLALPLAVLLPIGAASLILRIAKARYRAAFTAELPETLDIFARGLRAGRPVADSLAIVVDTTKGPVHAEFSRCHDEIRMGTSLADSLARLELRVPTPEVSFFSVATSLQTETGGNLIETMEGLAAQLRERRKLRKKARALSSEARASALILASLPFAVVLAIGFLNGGYLEPLYADPRGQVMSLVAISSISLGVFMMAQMGKLDV
ncbi:Bacterial type II secretion system protein F domain protein [Roseivivax sp. THAF40]|uniref:type II secretion system F family protein n=1 Tax=unclassified Roseivivax TaxID=2639302 RepID=UPI001267F3A1|nr:MULTISPECIES: type II secretion system F family protein [unclassified Roseivivax]QFS83740.1 Bacterial type II secretion system protein F domain protein [Roseivivax sp. THAF197b]QFT47542.1 Bacterial type II secretion system protein F domain protein [Roseivivax sp. THAF40]